MSKAIMLSIKPKWVAKILNGEKTVEVRKGTRLYKAIQKLIEQYGEATIYTYCTKGEQLVKYMYFRDDDIYALGKGNKIPFDNMINAIQLNGKVVACFKCKKVEHFEYDTCSSDIVGYWLDNGELFKLKGTCLTKDEFADYIKFDDGTAIHISDLEIFDKPKELSDFYNYKGGKLGYPNPNTKLVMNLKRPPQSYMFVEVDQ